MRNGTNESEAIDALKRAVRTYADRHANSDGLATTPIPGLRMMRVSRPSGPIRSMYRPLVCLILQGAKRMTAGREERLFTAGESAIVGVDLPVIGHIVQASRQAPYLAIAIELDMATMQSVASQIPESTRIAQSTGSALFGASSDDDIVSCAARLMRLLDRPEAEPVLRPAILQELHYWLLASSHGSALRALTLPNGDAKRIAPAIDCIRRNFREPIAVEKLAAAVNMSASAFHRRFRAVTSLSPLQFQKQLRLIEARRLMLNERTTARYAADLVGYESVSQFTREYGRMFGAPPRRDTINTEARSSKEENRAMFVMR